MASLTSTINVQVDAKIKKEATEILKGLGLNMSTFINMTLIQVVKRNDIPFKIENPKPSKELLEALKEGEEMLKHPENYPSYNNWKDLEKALLDEEI